MNSKDIIEGLERKYPLEAAEEWDNVGLLAGRESREADRVYLVLDLTKEALEEAIDWKADMIISHHPMVFSSIKRVNDKDFLGEKILRIIENQITYYAMHTNFDVLGMAEINAGLLKLQEPEVLYLTEDGPQGQQGIGRVGMLPREMSLEECAQYVKESFGLEQVKVFGDGKTRISRGAVSGGSGKSMVQPAIAAGAQVLITGDIDHHTGLDAIDMGMSIIDAGHYGTEYFFMKQVEKDLQEIGPELKTRCAKVKLPYNYI